MSPIEVIVNDTVQWLKLVVESTGALIVALGFVIGVVQFIRVSLVSKTQEFTAVRLSLARYLALALEFQLGADILSTAISPSWEQIGKLGAIAIIRTGLNFFLSREMQEEQRIRRGEVQVQEQASA